MKRNTSFIKEVERLINKIKEQDMIYGLYLEDHLIFDYSKDTVLYLGDLKID